MPDSSFWEELWIRNGKVQAFEGGSVSRGHIYNHVLQILCISSQPILQTLHKYASVLQGKSGISRSTCSLKALFKRSKRKLLPQDIHLFVQGFCRC